MGQLRRPHEGDPLAKAFAPGDLGSSKARAKKKDLETDHSAALKKAGVAASKQTNDYTDAINGFSVVATDDQAEKLASNPDVLTVLPDELRQKQSYDGSGDDRGRDDRHGHDTHGSKSAISSDKGETLRQFLGIDSKRSHGKPTAGQGAGELLGVIDSGIWPEHPSFADDGSYPAIDLPDLPGHPACDFGNTASNPEDDAWTCNNKLVGARQMLETYRAVIGVLPGEFDSARDEDGHGTHTASTAAGDANVRAWIYDESRTVDYTTASPRRRRSSPTRPSAPSAGSPRTSRPRSTRPWPTASTSSTTPSAAGPASPPRTPSPSSSPTTPACTSRPRPATTAPEPRRSAAPPTCPGSRPWVPAPSRASTPGRSGSATVARSPAPR